MDTAQKLAELEYYEQSNGNKGRLVFDKLPDEAKKQFISGASRVLIQIDKLNLMLVKKVTKEQEHDRKVSEEERVIGLIEKFNTDLKVFRKDVYPTKELALRIIKEVHGE